MEKSTAQVLPLSSNQLTPYACWRRVTIAFLIIDWQSGMLYSCDLSDQPPLTGKASFLPM